MRVHIVTYRLAGISEREYLDVANDVAARFAGMPGLLAKLWLEDAGNGRYGAVYFWEDEEAMERFLASDLFEGTNPDFTDLTSHDFGILENLTRTTQPILELIEPGRPPAPRVAPAPPSSAGRKTMGTKAGGPRKIPVETGTATKSVPAKASAKKPAKGTAKTVKAPAKAAKAPAKAAKGASKMTKGAKKARP